MPRLELLGPPRDRVADRLLEVDVAVVAQPLQRPLLVVREFERHAGVAAAPRRDPRAEARAEPRDRTLVRVEAPLDVERAFHVVREAVRAPDELLDEALVVTLDPGRLGAEVEVESLEAGRVRGLGAAAPGHVAEAEHPRRGAVHRPGELGALEVERQEGRQVAQVDRRSRHARPVGGELALAEVASGAEVGEQPALGAPRAGGLLADQAERLLRVAKGPVGDGQREIEVRGTAGVVDAHREDVLAAEERIEGIRAERDDDATLVLAAPVDLDAVQEDRRDVVVVDLQHRSARLAPAVLEPRPRIEIAAVLGPRGALAAVAERSGARRPS